MAPPGTALMSVRDRDKSEVIKLAKILISRGFDLVATDGTASKLNDEKIDCRRVNKVREGRPHIVDMIKNNEIDLIVNTTEGKKAINESASIRAALPLGMIVTLCTGSWSGTMYPTIACPAS